MNKTALLFLSALALFSCAGNKDSYINPEGKIYVYTLQETSGSAAYDEAAAVACIEGIVNREYPRIFVLSKKDTIPGYWLNKFHDGWMKSTPKVEVGSLEELFKIAGKKVKGAVIWDENVPASFNVATTVAGVEDGVVLTAAMAEKYGLKVISDLRGKFDGSVTSSAKNDAYMWAKSEYLDKGLCSKRLMCLYEDPARMRAKGDIGYVITRDWAVCNRSFVYDLSPWGDEVPLDDPDQALGTDLRTYNEILSSQMKQTAGKEMTEIAGFFSFWKYCKVGGPQNKHGDVESEWESVFIMSKYNCYQNTVASGCYNQSFHSKAPQTQGKQGRPDSYIEPQKGKTYLCIFMADYDSATPLYDFMPENWEDSRRGERPLVWGLNPNLCETFPDIFQWLYETRAEGDYFTSDASAAGYFNPNQIDEKYLPLFTEHNKKYFAQWDMSLAPMILDTDQPTPAVKDAFRQFAPDGIAEIVIDFHKTGGHAPETHLWDGMPVTELLNNVCNEGSAFTTIEQEAQRFAKRLSGPSEDPQFYLIRIVWVTPSEIFDVIDRVKELRPDLDIEMLDGYNYFHCLKTMCEKNI